MTSTTGPENQGGAENRPGPIIHVGDQGAASPDPIVSTTDPHPPSALGGHAAARSGSFTVEEDETDLE